ncbi:MAG TPA: formylglycine-generating enzyme family protein [Solirubrobacterales bacterium]|nr:formylglycine-generating enzyme family protein [Solirubrobacterales bacterium]
MPDVAITGMVTVPGGTFRMGSEDFYPEERPVRHVTVEEFRIDEHPVTNAEFAEFVDATGYVTLAERPVDAADYPDADPALLVPGSAVFRQPPGPVDLRSGRWWAYVPGASWRRPEGPGSDLAGRERHPVVHVAHEDALAYARWAGKALPTEAEWEYAARGGLEGATYAWGDELHPDGRTMANTWVGEFPWQDLCGGGFSRTSPVGSFPANGYGLVDVAGNVWEWTADRYEARRRSPSCCGPSAAPSPSCHAGATVDRSAVMVVKGGSHLCAPNYCLRYRPAARQGEQVDTSTSHVGFRCVVRRADIAD